MLSEKIDALAERLEPYEHEGLQAAPEAVQVIAAMLRSLAAEARHLEAAVVPDAERGQAAAIDPADLVSGRVVPLDACRTERKRFGVIPGGLE